MASFNFTPNLGIKSLDKFSHQLYLRPISGLVRQTLKAALVFLYCGSLADFGELSINVLVLRQSEANQELSLELPPQRNSVIVEETGNDDKRQGASMLLMQVEKKATAIAGIGQWQQGHTTVAEEGAIVAEAGATAGRRGAAAA
ncbi:hypothetical protein BHE74_00039430 [Ensete ventricosum]|nr:hypothetical protein BHE74_00039430 [Ensete ventricosum]